MSTPSTKSKRSIFEPKKIPYSVRDRHIYVIGKTRYGKSTFLQSLAYVDIYNGAGVCVIDGKGDLARSLLRWIPKHRMDDVIWLDLKSDNSVPIDFMSYEGDEEKEELVSGLIYILLKNDESLKRAEPILEKLLYSLVDVPGTTFLDAHDFFENPKRQKDILTILERNNPELHALWKHHFPTANEYSPITSRMSKFMRNRSLNAIFNDPKPRLNIARAMEERKVILVNLGGFSKSKKIFGALLLAQIQQALLRRGEVGEEKPTPFFLICDEFQRFQTESFDDLLSVAGGLGLRLTLAHQYPSQLSQEIRHALHNVSTYVIFRSHPDDAIFFKNEIPKLPAPAKDPNETLRRRLEAKRDALRLQIDMLRERPYDENYDKVSRELNARESDLRVVEDRLEFLPQPVQSHVPFDISMIPFLRQGEALYRYADGTAEIKFASPPPPPVSPEYKKMQNERVKYIKENTMRLYGSRATSAGSGQKRNVEKSGSDGAETVVELEKDDEIPPSTGPIKGVPSHGDKAKGPRGPR